MGVWNDNLRGKYGNCNTWNHMDRLKRQLPGLYPSTFRPLRWQLFSLSTHLPRFAGLTSTLSRLQADGIIRPAGFASGIWNSAERKYDPLVLEYRGLLKALKKFKFRLLGRYFSLKLTFEPSSGSSINRQMISHTQ